MQALTRENLCRQLRFQPLREVATAGCLLLMSIEASGMRMACTVVLTAASQPARSVWYEYDNLSRAFGLQCAAWMIWVPGVTLIYAMPSLLQIPTAILITSFWILIFTTLRERQNRDPRKTHS